MRGKKEESEDDPVRTGTTESSASTNVSGTTPGGNLDGDMDRASSQRSYRCLVTVIDYSHFVTTSFDKFFTKMDYIRSMDNEVFISLEPSV